MNPRPIVRPVFRYHPWPALVALALAWLTASCGSSLLPGGGNSTTVTAPSNLTATATSATQINLAWTDNSSNEDGFRIERAPGGTTTFAEIATVGAGVATYQNTGLSSSTSYTYRVRAYNSGVTSDYSATATATTQLSAPTAPSNLITSPASSSQINLSWTDNATNEDGFRIEQSTTGAGGFTEIATVAAGVTAYQNIGLTPSTAYTYRVRAYNSAGNSAYSNSAAGFTPALPVTPPVAPSALTATPVASNQVNLAWTDNSDNETGFHIERAPGGTTSFVEIASVNAGITAYDNAGLSASTSYAYRVRAYNAAGNSAYTTTATTTTPGGLAPPAAPSNLQTVPINSSEIDLTWNDNSSDEDGFRIERAPGGTTSFTEIGTVGPGVVVYASQGLTPSTSYAYRIRSYNAAGNSAYTSTATGSTAPTPPAAPTSFVATPVSPTQVNLSWTDNSSNEDGFQIDRAPGGTTTFVMVTQVAAGVTTYQNTGLSASTYYTYRVRAYNAGGYSAAATVDATTPAAATPPNAPSGLGATAVSSTQINLAWTDNSSDETGFYVERAPGGTTTFVQIATVGAGVTAYQNTGLTANTSYAYRVRAYNGAGNSAYTSTATTSTLVAPPAAPSGLTATAASDVQINLAWTDNSSNETGFRVEYAPGGTTNFVEIGTVGANVTTTPVNGLTQGHRTSSE